MIFVSIIGSLSWSSQLIPKERRVQQCTRWEWELLIRSLTWASIVRALRILEKQQIEYMVESSMEKALKRTKRIYACKYFAWVPILFSQVEGIHWETERRLRREVANIDSDVLLVLFVDCCLTGYWSCCCWNQYEPGGIWETTFKETIGSSWNWDSVLTTCFSKWRPEEDISRKKKKPAGSGSFAISIAF